MNPEPKANPRALTLLLNLGHAFDHLALLIFATAVGAIAREFGVARWEDLMPWGVGAFVMFGLASLPAGRLGDLWGRRPMMLVFFFGLGASALLCSVTQSVPQLAAALTLLGVFSAIYHPVGIPMLVRHAPNPGATIGVNGLSGNLGIALAAITTGALVKWLGWRAAFGLPGVLAIALGFVFARVAPREDLAPAGRRSARSTALPPKLLARVFAVMTVAAMTGGLLFNLTTNGNGQLLSERLHGVVSDPAHPELGPDSAVLGLLLAGVYALASLAQLVVGRLIDRMPLKPLQLGIVLAQVPLLLLAAYAQGWWLLAALLGVMVLIFGAIPFTDATIVRYIDDAMRSRVSGVRLTVSIGASSVAVWALGPLVKSAGFAALFVGMAGVALCTALVVSALPTEPAKAA